jgi:hypothetical protein
MHADSVGEVQTRFDAWQTGREINLMYHPWQYTYPYSFSCVLRGEGVSGVCTLYGVCVAPLARGVCGGARY